MVNFHITIALPTQIFGARHNLNSLTIRDLASIAHGLGSGPKRRGYAIT
jgi:hypothetical protein